MPSKDQTDVVEYFVPVLSPAPLPVLQITDTDLLMDELSYAWPPALPANNPPDTQTEILVRMLSVLAADRKELDQHLAQYEQKLEDALGQEAYLAYRDFKGKFDKETIEITMNVGLEEKNIRDRTLLYGSSVDGEVLSCSISAGKRTVKVGDLVKFTSGLIVWSQETSKIIWRKTSLIPKGVDQLVEMILERLENVINTGDPTASIVQSKKKS